MNKIIKAPTFSLFMGISLIACSAQAAQLVDAEAIQSGVANDNVNRALSLPSGSVLAAKGRVPITEELLKVRFQQFHQDVPIWNYSISADRTNTGVLSNFQGKIVDGIGEDINSTRPKLNRRLALQKAMAADVKLMNTAKDNLSNAMRLIENGQAKLWIRLDDNQTARLVYLVSYMTHYPLPRRPHFLIDAESGDILKRWQGLTFYKASGIGGNKKTGKYTFDKKNKPLLVAEKNELCYLTNDKVDTIDMNNTTFGGSIHRFPCNNNQVKSVNGAYSPLNDAHFFATETAKMFERWFGLKPLDGKLRMRVHYANKFENAFWDGNQVTFGDGGDNLYPLVSLDVTAHEISHGYTEQSSGLIYVGEAGAINESFADISGEAAEYFSRGLNDWTVGADIKKANGGLRYFNDPKRDRVSISHFSEYNSDLAVHQSAGIFNKAFFLLANKPSWDIKKAYELFVIANTVYWNAESTFTDAANAICLSARDKHYPVADVKAVFSDVGIPTVSCDAVDPFLATKLVLNESKENLNGFEGFKHYFSIDIPKNSRELVIRTISGRGDSDLYVKWGSKPSLDDYDCRPFETGTVETCSIQQPKSGTYHVMVHGNSAFSGVNLNATYLPACSSCPQAGGVSKDNISLAYDQWHIQEFEVPAEMKTLTVKLSRGSGDADLFVRLGDKPTDVQFDCRPQKWGNSEICRFENPKPGRWFAALKGYSKFSKATLDITWEP